MKQQRRAPRRDFIGRIKLTYKSGNQSVTSYGMIQDKSTGGFGIKFPKDIPVGTITALAQGSITQFGVIRHSSPFEGEFFIGIELCDLDESAKAAARQATAPKVSAVRVEERQRPIDIPFIPLSDRPIPTRQQPLPASKINDWFAMNQPEKPTP